MNSRSPDYSAAPGQRGVKAVTGYAFPAELAAIVGRRQELRQLSEILVETRLLTLSGVGGVGKSRLAHALAGRLGERYIGRAWLVELAAVGEPNLVASAIARSVGAEKSGREPLEASIARAIGGSRCLLVLDNCEHVVDAVAEVAYLLLQRCPRLRILATSRQALGLEGEATFTFPRWPFHGQMTGPHPAVRTGVRGDPDVLGARLCCGSLVRADGGQRRPT